MFTKGYHETSELLFAIGDQTPLKIVIVELLIVVFDESKQVYHQV